MNCLCLTTKIDRAYEFGIIVKISFDVSLGLVPWNQTMTPVVAVNNFKPTRHQVFHYRYGYPEWNLVHCNLETGERLRSLKRINLKPDGIAEVTLNGKQCLVLGRP